MKGKTLLISLCFLMSVSVFAQLKTIESSYFNKINISSDVKVFLEQGDETVVKIDEDKIKNVNVAILGKVLNIKPVKKNLNPADDIPEVMITVKELEAISILGAGELVSEKGLKGDKLNILVSGKGVLTADISYGTEIVNVGESFCQVEWVM